MRTTPRNSRWSAGVSLIELMIALLIGALLVLGLVQVFSASRTAYQTSEGLARVQENARFAMDFLQRDLRMAGHTGCVNDQAHFVRTGGAGGEFTNRLTAATGAGEALDFSVSVQGYEATGTGPDTSVTLGAASSGWSPALPGAIQALNPRAGSDIVVLRYFSPRGTRVNSISTGGVISIPLEDATAQTADGWRALSEDGVANPTMFGIGDCSLADVFAATGTTGAVTANATVATALQGRYTPAPEGQTNLYRAESLVYFVGTGAAGNPALRRARADSSGAYVVDEELVEGVESLQLIYGLDQTPVITQADPPLGNINQYVTAATAGATATNWRRVGAVQVGILVSSPASAAVQASAEPVEVLGVRFLPPAAADQRFRSSYQVTVALRNRLFGN